MGKNTTKRKSKKRFREQEEDSQEPADSKGKELQSNQESDSSDDEELLAAAGQWAQNDIKSVEVEKDFAHHHSVQETSNNFEERKIFSLHLTNLPFDAVEYDIRSFFEGKGCLITSTRLVYDRALDAGKAFRGVAFIDVADEKSYETALALTRSVFQGRKINIRPTRTKEELADIVSRTKDLVAEKIKTGKGAKKDKTKLQEKDSEEKTKADKEVEKEKVRLQEKDEGKIEAKKKSKSDRKHKHKKGGTDGKLTKKERNRRAAIIMSRRK
mmetsp:Transcript_18513/g.27442  ORF Transcript_18513/g.27442 Transcript_18513/m.27442 type:complete len:270 (-) Transcript_18513:32-841(-)